MLSILPLLIGALLSTFTVIWFLNAKNDLQFQCEEGVLKLQDILIRGERQLLQLNPVVEVLTLQKKYLQVAILAAPTPAEKIALSTQLVLVLKRMNALRNLQKNIYFMTQKKSQIESLAQNSILQKKLISLSQQWGKPAVVVQNKTLPQIHLEEVFKDPQLPIYKTPIDFPQKQKIFWHFSISKKSFFPRWLGFLQTHHFFWQEDCSSLPQKEGGEWKTRITKGTF